MLRSSREFETSKRRGLNSVNVVMHQRKDLAEANNREQERTPLAKKQTLLRRRSLKKKPTELQILMKLIRSSERWTKKLRKAKEITSSDTNKWKHDCVVRKRNRSGELTNRHV
ncbi:unnamed protein product [Albugo candida]|uniref:Uncharacterized protein n=1 Tax=Albugo candida TaxID=65357 RepID=A0A024GA64_9STRA|nr:unnamed protein product [Albugo candida]|eukprot:CCI43663.1 unnamed protein product [Albugo candida]